MDTQELEGFKTELNVISERYGIENAAFCGDNGSEFIGFFVVVGGRISMDDAWRSSLNVGRLWQYAREAVRNILNNYEKKGW